MKKLLLAVLSIGLIFPLPALAVTNPPTTQFYEGWLDAVNSHTISGWAYDNDKPVTIKATVANADTSNAQTFSFQTTADTMRPDAGTYISNKFHIGGITVPTGFSIDLTQKITEPGLYYVKSLTYNNFKFENYPIFSASMVFSVGGVPGGTIIIGPPAEPIPPTCSDPVAMQNTGRGFVAKTYNDPTVYYIDGMNQFMPIFTAKVFLSYGNKWENVQLIQNCSLVTQYTPVRYIKVKGDDRVYTIENTTVRYMTPAACTRLNVDPRMVVEINRTEFDSYQKGTIVQ